MNTHLLDSVEHKVFLASGIQDPLTKSPFKAGDVIVFCAKCKTPFLQTTWQESVNKCPIRGCKHPHTTSDFPAIATYANWTRPPEPRPIRVSQQTTGGFSRFVKNRLLPFSMIIVSLIIIGAFVFPTEPHEQPIIIPQHCRYSTSRYPFTLDCNAFPAELCSHAESVQNWFIQMKNLDPCDHERMEELTDPVHRTQIVAYISELHRKSGPACSHLFKGLIQQMTNWEENFVSGKKCAYYHQ